jgi:hypothetical protein
MTRSGLYNISRGIRHYSSNSNRGCEKDIIRDIKEGYININNIDQSNVLKPIFKSKLLAPIVYTDYIIENINYCENVLSRIPDSNIVKQFLMENLEEPIKVTACRGNNSNKVNKAILEFNNIVKKCEEFEGEEFEVKKGSKFYVESCYPNDIIRNKYSYDNGSSFRFKPNYIFINSKVYNHDITTNYKTLTNNSIKNKKMTEEVEYFDIIKIDDKNNHFIIKTMMVNHFLEYIKSKGKCVSVSDLNCKSCCYIITFNNNLYYYIGSTRDIKSRAKNQFNNIKKVINDCGKYLFING